MSINQTVTCDGCGKDATQGNGRYWQLVLNPVRISAIPSTVVSGSVKPPRYDMSDPGHGPLHFHDHACLAAWAVKEKETHESNQTSHEAALAQDAKDAAAKPAA